MKVSSIIRVPEIEKEFHKPANYEDMKADIARRGIQEPVVVNGKNQLLCGYTRLAIAEDLGLVDIPHRAVDITEPEAMLEYAILDNIRRRQLTDLELVEYGIKLEAIYGNRQGERSDFGTECPEVTGRTRDVIAGKLGETTGARMSGKKYDRLKMIATQAIPEVKRAYERREISQEKALLICREPPGLQELSLFIHYGLEICKKKLLELKQCDNLDEAVPIYKDIKNIADPILGMLSEIIPDLEVRIGGDGEWQMQLGNVLRER